MSRRVWLQTLFLKCESPKDLISKEKFVSYKHVGTTPLLKKKCFGLGWVAHSVGASSHTPKGSGFNSWSGTYLSCRFYSGQREYGRQLTDVSLSHGCFFLSLSVPLSLKSINISPSED